MRSGGSNWAPTTQPRIFVYDLYFYLNAPQFAQALEFDVNQSVGGYKHIFGVQVRCSPCRSVAGMGRGWTGLRNTGVACSTPSGYTWHHLVEEFQRGSNGQVTFVLHHPGRGETLYQSVVLVASQQCE